MGVVGSRVHSPYAEDSLKLLLPDVINQGIVIVSGLAKGTDSIVHQMTMNYCGKTIAVIGTGLDVVYPRGNVMLQNEVAAKGLLLTEYPLGSQPLKFHFPQRNRIIAGLVQTMLRQDTGAERSLPQTLLFKKIATFWQFLEKLPNLCRKERTN